MKVDDSKPPEVEEPSGEKRDGKNNGDNEIAENDRDDVDGMVIANNEDVKQTDDEAQPLDNDATGTDGKNNGDNKIAENDKDYVDGMGLANEDVNQNDGEAQPLDNDVTETDKDAAKDSIFALTSVASELDPASVAKELNHEKAANELTHANSDQDDELGIYDDTDDGDDLSETELNLVKLREEQQKRKLEQKKQSKDVVNESDANQIPDKPKEISESTEKAGRVQIDHSVKYTDKPSATIRTGLTSGFSVKTWSAPPKCIQGVSIKDLHRPSGFRRGGETTTMVAELAESRNASRLAMESREAMFRRAMSLLSARCTSVKQQADGEEQVPFGIQIPKYFYVTQEKPVPMEPLKAWRGYNGNVYFEPININPMNNENLEEEQLRAQTTAGRLRRSERLTAKLESSKSAPHESDKENLPESRCDSRQTMKSSVGSRHSSTRQMAILDKQSVVNKVNENIHEDIVWLEGQENTGSLAVRPRSYPDRMGKDKERDILYNKERIKKGSVAHQLYIEKRSKQKPRLRVSGGKFTPPTSMSPLLRTQTQYSLSNQRLTTNSPDPYHLNESKLPPLEQVRASLKHPGAPPAAPAPHGKSYTRSVTITDGMKPFVKYSPDVVARLSQQANMC